MVVGQVYNWVPSSLPRSPAAHPTFQCWSRTYFDSPFRAVKSPDGHASDLVLPVSAIRHFTLFSSETSFISCCSSPAGSTAWGHTDSLFLPHIQANYGDYILNSDLATDMGLAVPALNVTLVLPENTGPARRALVSFAERAPSSARGHCGNEGSHSAWETPAYKSLPKLKTVTLVKEAGLRSSA